jgi:hypothetical protein
MKIFLCPECYEVFSIQNKSEYENKYDGKYFDKYSCMVRYKKRKKKIKVLGLENEKK